MNPAWLSAVGNHLWQSTLFAGVAGLLTLTLRKNHARVRHSVWLVASCKFLIPLSVLIGLGGHIRWRTAPEDTPSGLFVVMNEVSQPIAAPEIAIPALATAARSDIRLPAVLLAVWLCGFLGIACSWWFRWRRIRAVVHSGSPLQLEIPIPARSSPTLLEPGIFGVYRPVLLLPEGIFERLTPAQLQAVITHELCHVRHRDNLIASIHMFVETVFWFYPLVWWIGKRIVEERERACDEEVLRLGSEPRVYADGILNVCKLYLESPLVCVSGVTGSNLKKRIEAIMSNRAALRVNFIRKAALVVAGVATLAVPLVLGIVNAPSVNAQEALQNRSTFEVASVKPASVPDGLILMDGGGIGAHKGAGVPIPRNTGGPGTGDPGRIHYPLISLKELLQRAWSSYYEIDGPGWLNSQTVAVDATMSPDTTKEQFQEMLRNLITERFALKHHEATKEVGGYALVVAKNGVKMKESSDQSGGDWARPSPPTRRGPDGFPILSPGPGHLLVEFGAANRSRIIGQQVSMQEMAEKLGRNLKSIVTDATGLAARYDFILTYASSIEPSQALPSSEPEAAEPVPGIFSAVQSQLGLKLEPKKVPVQVMVIDHMEKTPTGN